MQGPLPAKVLSMHAWIGQWPKAFCSNTLGFANTSRNGWSASQPLHKKQLNAVVEEIKRELVKYNIYVQVACRVVDFIAGHCQKSNEAQAAGCPQHHCVCLWGGASHIALILLKMPGSVSHCSLPASALPASQNNR